MPFSTILGVAVVAAGGFLSGGAAWPIKLMKRYQFEHWWFISMLTGLILVPWTVTLTCCPHALLAFTAVPRKLLMLANLTSLGWGAANVLCGICLVRIGFALTTAILVGIGASAGVIIPLIFKGSGTFRTASDISSRPGLIILAGVGLMLLAVTFATRSGQGRERSAQTDKVGSKSFARFLPLAIIAGGLSSGISLSFVYSQEEIIHAMKLQGASDLAAVIAVWAGGLLGGAMVSLGYPLYLMTKNHSWAVIRESSRELLLSALIGINFAGFIVLMGKGMLMIGPLGASVGFGVQQGTWLLGGQAVGLLSGEWSGVGRTARKQMYLSVALLVIAILVMAYANGLATSRGHH